MYRFRDSVNLSIFFLVIIGLLLICSPTAAVCQKTGKQKSAGRITSSRLKFRSIMDADGVMINGCGGSSHLWVSSDGVRVTQEGIGCQSVELSQAKLDEKLKGAITIIERQPIFDGSRKVAERIIAQFPGRNGGAKVYSIIRADGSGLSVIEAPSLRHALAFEAFENRQ